MTTAYQHRPMSEILVADPEPVVNEPNPSPAAPPAAPAPTPEPQPLAEKYQGKTVEQIAEMHANAEKELGRTRNELNVQKGLVQDLSQLNRQVNAPEEPAPVQEEVTITGDQLISDRSFNYPNYAEIEHILRQASSLYPDSHYLAGLTTSMLRSKQTAIEVLRSQLNQLLLNQQYQPQKDAPDPYSIVADLSRIDSSYQVEPDSAETTAYSSSFEQAIASNDAEALQQLIRVGELIFAKHNDTASLVLHGRQLAEAVDAMADYRQQQNDGLTAAFPYQAAELFYQHSFAQLEAELSSGQKAAEIDAVYDKLQQFNNHVPSDFVLHVALRRKLADKYLSLSAQLLQSNQVRTAERLMRRANELMSSINS